MSAEFGKFLLEPWRVSSYATKEEIDGALNVVMVT